MPSLLSDCRRGVSYIYHTVLISFGLLYVVFSVSRDIGPGVALTLVSSLLVYVPLVMEFLYMQDRIHALESLAVSLLATPEVRPGT